MEQIHWEPGAHPYQRIGGWLRFLQVAMILAMAGVGVSLLGDLAVLLQAGDIPAFLVSLLRRGLSVLGLFPTLQLFRRNPRFLRNFHLVFFFNYTWSALALLRPFLTGLHEIAALFEQSLGLGRLAPAIYTAYVILALAGSLVMFILCRLYYTQSVRVRSYMGTAAYITGCPFTRHITPPPSAAPDVPAHIPWEQQGGIS